MQINEVSKSVFLMSFSKHIKHLGLWLLSMSKRRRVTGFGTDLEFVYQQTNEIHELS